MTAPPFSPEVPPRWENLRDRTIHELFTEQAARNPGAVALSAEDGFTLTYGQLDAAAVRLARRLADHGVSRGDLVGIHAPRSPALVVGLLAILRAGAAYVALDADSPPARREAMLADARPAVVLAPRSRRGDLPVGMPWMELSDPGGDEGTPPRAAADNTGRGGDSPALDLAYVCFTSGSTGQPKGVCIPHRGVVRLVRAADYVPLGPGSVLLQFAPVAFDAATFEIWGALLNGARLAVFPARRPSLAELGRFIEAQGVTTLWLSAGLFHQFVDHGPLELLRGVRHWLVGGDVLSVPHVRRAVHALPDCQFINGYGPTENTTFTCCYPIPRQTLPSATGSIPIGWPVARTECDVLDDARQPVPEGEPGELYVGGDGLARGYLRRPELTATRFFTTDAGRRLYRTGDRVRRLPGGELEFLGRLDRQVKVRGFRVELDEIEAVLGGHPGVHAVAVVVRTGRAAGEEHLAAFVAATAPAPEEGELRRFAQARLPASMVPGTFTFVNELPLDDNGKVDRRALEDRLPAPPGSVPPSRAGEEAAAGPDAAGLDALWHEVLGRKDVPANANFFELGGDSLRATHLLARVHAVLGRDVPLDVFLETPTLAALTAFLRRPGPAPARPLAAGTDLLPMRGPDDAHEPPRPPLFCVPGQGGDLMCYAALVRHLPAGRPVFGLQSPRLLRGEDEGETIAEIAARHVATLRAARQLPETAGRPLHLLGFCFGGLLAHEIARQLRAAGERDLGLVAVVDYPMPLSPEPRSPDGGRWRNPWAFARHLARVGLDFVALTPDDRRAELRHYPRRLATRWTGGRGPHASSTLRLQGITADLSHYTDEQLRLLETHERAWQSYVPVPDSGSVLLMRPRRAPWRYRHDPTLGWGKVPGLRVDVRVIAAPGQHGHLLREPYVRHLADSLADALAAAERPHDDP